MPSLDNRRIAVLSAYAITLHIIERLIPTPVPWLRFGFANIITLVAIILYGIKTGLFITLIRVFIGSLFTGTFLGPGFLLSLGGGIMSTLAMGAGSLLGERIFSPLGLSLLGAFVHNITQLMLAYLVFIRKIDVILYLSPLILLLGMATGTLNGIVCLLLIKKLRTDLEQG
jgi:heptaprenyl diphosphate synthase